MKSGPLIIVEDDDDDKGILTEILAELGVNNRVIWFTRCSDAINYLTTTTDQPFLILSDVNLPGETGIEMKRKIDKDPLLRQKSIPFVFYSTAAEKATVNEAYITMTVQGFFKKSHTYLEIKNQIKIIMDYWKHCIHPNTM